METDAMIDRAISKRRQEDRQDRAREVALRCAIAFHGPNPDGTASLVVADAVDVFLPFLLGEDKL